MSDRPGEQPYVKVPTPLRIGGAFMAVGIALIIFTAVQVFMVGWMVPFQVDVRFLLILVAAGIIGGFATMQRNQEPSRTQVVALVIALVLVFGGRLIPNPVLMMWEQYWLPMYALLAIGCGLAIRRTMMR